MQERGTWEPLTLNEKVTDLKVGRVNRTPQQVDLQINFMQLLQAG